MKKIIIKSSVFFRSSESLDSLCNILAEKLNTEVFVYDLKDEEGDFRLLKVFGFDRVELKQIGVDRFHFALRYNQAGSLKLEKEVINLDNYVNTILKIVVPDYALIPEYYDEFNIANESYTLSGSVRFNCDDNARLGVLINEIFGVHYNSLEQHSVVEIFGIRMFVTITEGKVEVRLGTSDIHVMNSIDISKYLKAKIESVGYSCQE